MMGSIGVTRRVDRTGIIPTERPNTVAGLKAKRAELARLQIQLTEDLRRVMCDMDHLDGAIRLFEAEQPLGPAARFRTAYRAKAGQLSRFLFDRLREAGRPLTSPDLAQEWIAAREIRNDHGMFLVIRRRIGSQLCKLVRNGQVRAVDIGGKLRGYELVRD